MKLKTLAELEKHAVRREAKLRADFEQLVATGRVSELVDLASQMVGNALRANDRLIWKQAMSRFPLSSEKMDPKQLSLLIESLAADEAETKSESTKDESVDELVDDIAEAVKKETPEPAAKPRGHGRRKLPAGLPREVVTTKIPDQDRTCLCCGGLRTTIGFETSEVLELVPAHFKVVVQQREKLACPVCKNGVDTAAATPKLLDKLLAGPVLMTHLVVSKFEDHLPLYRLERLYRRLGVPIARSTLGGWAGVAANALEPIVDEMWRDLMASFLVHADGTGIRVLDNDAPDGRRVGTMWAHVSEDVAQRVVVFRYAADGTGDEGPWKNLAGRQGYFQADAASIFDRCFDGTVASAVEVGCWAHARRKFFELIETDSRAAIPMKLIAGLYQVERLADVRELDADARRELRQDKSRRILDRLEKWLDDIRGREPPASAMAKAVNYALNHWDALSRFLEHGRLPLDNTLCEQQIRPVAVGRHNYLFVGGDIGGERAATLYSIIRTCALNGVNPVEYLVDVFGKLASNWPNRRIGELTPYGWAKAKKAANEAQAQVAAG